MLRLVVVHEMLENFFNYKFVLLLALSVALPLILMPLLISDFHGRLEAYTVAVKEDAQELQRTPAYSALQVVIRRRPNPLTIFSQGIEHRANDRVIVSPKQLLHFDRYGSMENMFLALFPQVDVTTSVLMFFSILALAFSYNLVCGEKQNGTLRLVLSQSVTRTTFLLGKILAGLVALLIPLVCFFGTTLMFIETTDPTMIKASEWKVVLLIFLASLLYTIIFYLLGALFSTLTHRPVVSFLLSLSCWVVLVILLPQVIANLSPGASKRSEEERLRHAAATLTERYYQQIERLLRTHPPSRWGYSRPAGFFIFDTRSEVITAYTQRVGQIEEEAVNAFSRLAEAQYETYQAVYVRERSHTLLFFITPAGAYQSIVSLLCGTSESAYFHFLEACFDYRRQLIDYYKNHALFTSPRLFMARSPLDLHRLPRFIEREWRERDAGQIAFGLAFLALLVVLLFTLTYVLFLRFDVR